MAGNSWCCPQCKGHRITTINEHMVCLSCGYQEYLFDYKNSHDYGYSDNYTTDNQPPQPKVDNKALEELREIALKALSLGIQNRRDQQQHVKEAHKTQVDTKLDAALQFVQR